MKGRRRKTFCHGEEHIQGCDMSREIKFSHDVIKGRGNLVAK
jgi:hypothetical protein